MYKGKENLDSAYATLVRNVPVPDNSLKGFFAWNSTFAPINLWWKYFTHSFIHSCMQSFIHSFIDWKDLFIIHWIAIYWFIIHSSFIHHSFIIYHSLFIIHSSFIIHHSFAIHKCHMSSNTINYYQLSSIIITYVLSKRLFFACVCVYLDFPQTFPKLSSHSFPHFFLLPLTRCAEFYRRFWRLFQNVGKKLG